MMSKGDKTYFEREDFNLGAIEHNIRTIIEDVEQHVKDYGLSDELKTVMTRVIEANLWITIRRHNLCKIINNMTER